MEQLKTYETADNSQEVIGELTSTAEGDTEAGAGGSTGDVPSENGTAA